MSSKSVTYDRDAEQLRKDRRRNARKALFGNDLTKGFYPGEGGQWADKFAGSPHHVDALQLAKEKMRVDRDRDRIYDQHDMPWEEQQKLTGAERDKREASRKAANAKHSKREKACHEKMRDLEEKLIDHRIKQAKEWQASNPVASKSLAGVAGKVIGAVPKGIKKLARRADPAAPEKAARKNQPILVKKSGADLEKAKKLSHAEKRMGKQYPNYKEMGGAGKKNLREHDRAWRDSLKKLPKAKPVKKSNTVDLDVDAGLYGIGSGQEAMRVQPNGKCNGCGHYAKDNVACQKGLVPSVCGDGSYPEIGYAPVAPNRIAAKNWTQLHADAVAIGAQAGRVEDSPVLVEIPYRIEVIGDSALALSEKMTLVKSYLARNKDHRPRAIVKATGVVVLPPREVPLAKGRMGLDEFADLLGTTTEVVQSIAAKLGNRDDFASFIKGKMPDIQMAHGLNEQAVNQLYRAATRVVRSLSENEWSLWKGVDFGAACEDEALARAIEQNGLLDPNGLQFGLTIQPAEPPVFLPAPEPVQTPPQEPVVTGFVGGNLHLADSL